MMDLFRYDAKQRRLWIAQQRIHHGVVGTTLAAFLCRWHPRLAIIAVLWALTDVHDLNSWFVLGSQCA
jgi:hypothetical protein